MYTNAAANKKGGRCKPPLLTDPPKPEHSRGCVPATPGSQSLYLLVRNATAMPVRAAPHDERQFIENQAVSLRLAPDKCLRHVSNLQILTDGPVAASNLWENVAPPTRRHFNCGSSLDRA